MSLPALRVAFLRGWPQTSQIAADLREYLLGKVLFLPDLLPEIERDEIADMLSLLLDLPLEIAAQVGRDKVGYLYIETIPVAVEPRSIRGSVRLCARLHTPGDRYLEMPASIMVLRDAVVDCIGLKHSGTRIQRVAAWTQAVADSPSTALRFAGGAIARFLERPDASDVELYCAGLAAAAGWLLRGLEARVAQWVLAAAASPEPDRLVSTDAALLGRTAALQRAFEAGLVHTLPDEPGAPLDLRRPLEVLGQLSDAPIQWPDSASPMALIAAELRPHLLPEVRLVFDRLLRPAPPPLGLSGRRLARFFAGRDEVLKRLVVLCEPANEIRTTVLYGVDGIGKSQVAAAVGERLGHRLEPIWVRFAEGPEKGYTRLASALGIPAGPPNDERDESGIPRWVRDIHDAIRDRACLLVIEDADSVTEEALPAWLPAGAGSAVVLVLSERSQRPLQRRNDAIAVHLGALSPDDSRRLLAAEAPKLAEAIERGEASGLLEKLGGYPRAILLTAALAEQVGLEEVTRLVSHGTEVIRGVLGPLLDSLDERESAMLRALTVCAPGGSPPELPIRIAKGDDGNPLLSSLADRAFIVQESRSVRIDGPVRIEMERRLDERQDRRAELEEAHARLVLEAIEGYLERSWPASSDAWIDDALLAIDRMGERCRARGSEAASLVVGLAAAVQEYPRGGLAANLLHAIKGLRAVLSVYTRESFPREWAIVQSVLGVALRLLPTGDRTENLKESIDALHAALTVFTKEELPEYWASVQNSLGNALCEPPMGDRSENLNEAVKAFRAALTVFSKEELPQHWALTQNNLGTALGKLPTGDRGENLKEAAETFRAALTVFTKDQSPREWGRTQNNLGNVHANLPTGDRSENLKQAVEAFRAALTVRTREEFPRDWATTQNNLGNALSVLPTGNRDENLKQAIAAYRAALTVHTKEELPWDWARTQRNLGLELADLPTGDRRENLRQAVEAFRAALEVLTPENFPEDHARTTQNLEAALRDLAALDVPPADPS